MTGLSGVDHVPASSEPTAQATDGAAMVDIGRGIGAAVIYTDSSLVGVELEIRPQGEEWRGRHSAVRERQLPDSAQHAALFAQLAEGAWELRRRGTDDGPVLTVSVVGGSVAEAHWPPQPGAGGNRE